MQVPGPAVVLAGVAHVDVMFRLNKLWNGSFGVGRRVGRRVVR